MLRFVASIRKIGDCSSDGSDWQPGFFMNLPCAVLQIGSVEMNLRLAASAPFLDREVVAVRPQVTNPPKICCSGMGNNCFFGKGLITQTIGCHHVGPDRQPLGFEFNHC